MLQEASDLKRPHEICEVFKNVRGDCIFEPNLNLTVPGKFLEAPFQTNITPLALQKLPVALVQFAPPRQGPCLKFRRRALETLLPALVPLYLIKLKK